MIEKDYPDEDIAFEAGYLKVYCFYLLEDRDLADVTDSFLKRWAGKKKGHEYVAKVALIRADHFFNTSAYEEAANAFEDVPLDTLSPSLRANALFNMGYAQLEAKQYQGAAGSLTRFLTENPNHELAANALAHRGAAFREMNDFAKAKADFRKVAKDFPKSAPAELAWYQLATMATVERNHAERIEAFENLVKLFPQSQAVPQAWFGIGSAAFETENWTKAQDALRRAIRLDPKSYVNSASQMLVLSYYAQEDERGLSEAIDEFLAKLPSAAIPPNVIGWLGLSLFSKDDLKTASKYLALAATQDEPGLTQPAIWNYLGMSQVESGDHKKALESLGHFLSATPQPGPDRGRALLYLSRAHLGLADHDKALEVADEALGFIKAGRLHADLLIQEGDVYFARALELDKQGKASAAKEEFRGAAAKYIVPSQFFVDPVITPLAAWKTILALEKAGDVDRSNQLRKELASKYPNYTPPIN